MKEVDNVPNGTVATGIDVAWIADNSVEIAKTALESIGCKWDRQTEQNRKNWVENVQMFADAVCIIAARETAGRAGKGAEADVKGKTGGKP